MNREFDPPIIYCDAAFKQLNGYESCKTGNQVVNTFQYTAVSADDDVNKQRHL
jgi:hypothetical protein